MPFSITIQPAAGGSYLENAAANLAPGAWTQLSGMNGLTWALIEANSLGGPNENMVEFGHKGVYDPVRKKIRFWGGPHASGSQSATIEYDVATNTWARVTNSPFAGGAHGYDLNAMNPTTGEHFIRHYLSTAGSRWNGTTWSTWTPDPGNGNYWGLDWSPTRNGILAFSEQSGVRFWNGSTWSAIATVTGRTVGFHFVVVAHKTNGTAWIQDGNGSTVNWRLNADNTITRLDTLAAPPITLGSSGSNGRFSVYDYRTGRFVVANPFGSAFYDFDLATNTWTSLGNKAPLNCPDLSNVEGFVTAIPDFGGVILYFMASGTNGTPRAYLYKHS